MTTFTIEAIRRLYDGPFFDDHQDLVLTAGVHGVPGGALFLTGPHPDGRSRPGGDQYHVHRVSLDSGARTRITTLTLTDGTDLVLTGAAAARAEVGRLAALMSGPQGEDLLHEYLTRASGQPAPHAPDRERWWRTAVGIRYRAARRRAGLSLEELADRAGATPADMRAIEDGSCNDFALLIRTAVELGEELDSLYANYPIRPARGWPVGDGFIIG